MLGLGHGFESSVYHEKVSLIQISFEWQNHLSTASFVWVLLHYMQYLLSDIQENVCFLLFFTLVNTLIQITCVIFTWLFLLTQKTYPGKSILSSISITVQVVQKTFTKHHHLSTPSKSVFSDPLCFSKSTIVGG